MKKKLAKVLIGTLAVASLITPTTMINASTNENAVTYQQEILTPDLSLPSLSKLKLLRIDAYVNKKAVTTSYYNWVSDRPELQQTLQIQCIDLETATEVWIKVVDRSTGITLSEKNIKKGEGFNFIIRAYTQWDLYVKGDKAGKATITVSDRLGW